MNDTATRPPRLRLDGVDDPPRHDFDYTTQLLEHERRRQDSKAAGSVEDAGAALEGRRNGSRFVEDINGDGATATTNESTTSTPPTQSLVNPATVPIRTSSNNAVAGAAGERRRSSSLTGKTPRKHTSMASVPEEKERDRRKHYPEVDGRTWLAQNRHNRSVTDSSAPASTGNGDPFLGVGADLIGGDSPGWSPEKENILRGPFEYLESHPGKDIRTSLITAFNAWLQVPPESLGIITGVVTMLHTASLLIDDVEDSSQLRRGVPVAHSIFGTAQTINSANYAYFCALQELSKLNNPSAIQIYTEELLNLHRGQGMDLFWRDTLTCPSEDDYLEMVGNKTGGLFRLAIKLMCAESPTNTTTHPHPPSPSHPDQRPTDYVPLVNTIGLLFQILDDYKNLSSSIYTANKGMCEDLTEGKFSFPIIHAIRADPANLVLVNILKQKTEDVEVKRYAVAYMERAGSFAYTRRVLRGLTRRALALVEEVDGGRGRGVAIRGILEKLRVERGGERASRVSEGAGVGGS